MNGKKTGFTLIELLVVVAIIGLLAGIVLASLSTARTRAYTVRTQAELKQVLGSIVYAQSTGRSLLQITGNNCSDCPCRGSIDLRNIATSHACYINWINAINDIEAVNASIPDISNFTRDPWGSPYLLDENEGEGGGCTPDNFRSAGPDGVRATSDDIIIAVPLATQACQ